MRPPYAPRSASTNKRARQRRSLSDCGIAVPLDCCQDLGSVPHSNPDVARFQFDGLEELRACPGLRDGMLMGDGDEASMGVAIDINVHVDYLMLCVWTSAPLPPSRDDPPFYLGNPRACEPQKFDLVSEPVSGSPPPAPLGDKRGKGRTMRLTEAFRRYGVELINPQWTSSTVSDEPPHVILEPEQIGMPRVARIGF